MLPLLHSVSIVVCIHNMVLATQLTAQLCMWTDFKKQVVDRLVQQRLCSSIMYKEMILKKEQLEGAHTGCCSQALCCPACAPPQRLTRMPASPSRAVMPGRDEAFGVDLSSLTSPGAYDSPGLCTEPSTMLRQGCTRRRWRCWTCWCCPARRASPASTPRLSAGTSRSTGASAGSR